jgi:hypothetical protein
MVNEGGVCAGYVMILLEETKQEQTIVNAKEVSEDIVQ